MASQSATVAMLAKPTAPDHIERRPESDEATAAKAEAPVLRAATKPAPSHVAAHAKLDQAELAAAGGTRIAEADAVPPAHKPKAAPTLDDETAAAGQTKAVAKAQATKATAVRPIAVEKAATANTAAVAAGRSAVVQIGAFSSSALADKGYAEVSTTLADRMGGKSKHVQPLDKDGTTLYRTWLSGFATRADAVSFCDALKAKGKTCLVKG